MIKKIILIFGICFTLSCSNTSYAQCSMCKANVKNGASSHIKKTGTGVNNGIMSLIFVPYAAVGVIGLLFYKNYKQKNISNG